MRQTCWVVILLAGCGTERSAVEKCDDMVDVVCDRIVQCLGFSRTECVQAVKSELPCGSAKQVSASYDRCIDQLEGNSCAVLFPVNPTNGQAQLRLPADCMQVILTLDAPATTSITESIEYTP
jgi:hypothetical protein